MQGLNIRALAALFTRERIAQVLGKTFRGKRDLYKALGYKVELQPPDYRGRFQRNAVANRLVKALPKSTWRGGAEIIEDEDPDVDTEFENAFDALNKRLNIWSTFQKVDILAGINRYAVILIGAPGRMEDPLERCTPEDVKYLSTYSEEDARIFKFDIDETSERFGLPLMYNVTRATMTTPESINSNTVAKQVHWTRMIHIADGALDDRIYGEPRLRCVWNLLDDLEKISGSGSEAFWMRADGGTQFDLDPTIDFEDEADPNSSTPTNAARNTGVKKQIEEMEHGLRRNLLTRGVTVSRMGSDVADFASPVGAIISLISAGTGIPQRVLMGSEQGKLAAKMDRSNWDDTVADRRDDFAAPMVVRPLIDRLVQLGALPTPQEAYEVRWPKMKILDDEQRAAVAAEWAGLNAAAGTIVVTADEIRDRVLNLPPLEEVLTPEELAAENQSKVDKANPPVAKTPAVKAAMRTLEAAIEAGDVMLIETLTGLKLT